MLQLDKTRIVIRERHFLDLVDLSLRILRSDFRRLLVALIFGALPFAVLNYWLIGWRMEFEFRASTSWVDDLDLIMSYCWHMFLLIYFEASLGTIFVTAYLGQFMFMERPRVWTLVKDTLRMSGRILLLHGLLRGLVFVPLIYLMMDRTGGPNVGSNLLLMIIFVVVTSLRAFRPFLNEMIVLERSPLFAKDPSTVTLQRRSSQLHGPGASDLFGRFLGAALLGAMGFVMVYGVVLFSTGTLLNDWSIGPLSLMVFMPMTVWGVAGFLALVRFLGYLDLRIRQEGWEVELRLRAEGARLEQRFS